MAKKQKDEKPDLQDDLEAALLLKDADEALRQERMENLWKAWGSTIIGIALMLVFGTMVGVGWKSWRTSVYQSQTAQIINAQKTGTTDLLANKDNFSGHYGGVAALLAASDVTKQTAIPADEKAKTIHNLMMDADAAGLPRQYDILAQWGALRTRADVEMDKDINIEIANDMMGLADKRGNPYQPLIMVEAAAIYGAHDMANRAVEILNNVTEKDNTMNADFLDMVGALTRLYETDIILSAKDK